MKRIDITASLLIIFFSLIAIVYVIPNHTPKITDAGDLPPSLIPTLSLVVCIFTSLIVLISALRTSSLKNKQDGVTDAESGEVVVFGWNEFKNFSLIVISSVITWKLLEVIGFEIVTGVLVAGCMVYGGIRNKTIICILSVSLPVLIKYLVQYCFNVQLP